MSEDAKNAWFISLAGPPLQPLEIAARPGGVTVGRHDSCEVQLPPEGENVSRLHARISHADDQWRILDLKSRWGTYVNGQRISTERDTLLAHRDLVRIGPWTFSFSTTIPTATTGLESHNDLQAMQTMVRSVREDQVQPLAQDLLAHLLEAAAGIHAARSEQDLARVLLDEAIRGTGLSRAAFLRPLNSDGQIEVVAAKPQAAVTGESYSRSLLAAASRGVVAELSGENRPMDVAASIVQMRISVALCVPIMLAGGSGEPGTKRTVAAYLYLDARDEGGGFGATGKLRANASAYCVALARMGGLSLSNLKRIEMEHRQATMDAEIEAAAEAQRWILPPRQQTCGNFDFTGQSRPGRYLGGDFFDVIPLHGGRVAVSLGDVSGKGMAAAVLMTAAQGYLHSALSAHADVAEAVTRLNQFVSPRVPDEKFLTLWAAIFDPILKTVTYIDAGHGYALLLDANGKSEPLTGGGGPPVGVVNDFPYEAVCLPLPDAGRLVIVSDGIIEQPAPGGGELRQFGLEGLHKTLADTAVELDVISAIFLAVETHAQTIDLADDATAVVIRW